MGSLILLLLVIDRRAKAVARAKAEQTVARAVAEEAKLAADQQAARQAEWDRRRQQLHDLLAREEEEVVTHIKSIQGNAATVTAEMQAEEARFRDLRLRLETEAGQLERKHDELTARWAARQAAVAQASAKADATKQQLAQMAGELERLEQTLRDLRALRERDKQTYSLLPYIGRHGDNRRPIYVECTAAGLVFHPDRLMLEGPSLLPMRIREEVERRIARQRETLPVEDGHAAGKTEQSPYLLMLVRPNGIASYYRTQSALVGLKIDFGYEFVEADWILDFSADDNATAQQPWMTAGPARSVSPARPPERAGPPRPVPAGVGHPGGYEGPGAWVPQEAGRGRAGGPGAQADGTSGTSVGGPGGGVSGGPNLPGARGGPAGITYGGSGRGGDGSGPLFGALGPGGPGYGSSAEPGGMGLSQGSPQAGQRPGFSQGGTGGPSSPDGIAGSDGPMGSNGDPSGAPRRGNGQSSGYAALGSGKGMSDSTGFRSGSWEAGTAGGLPTQGSGDGTGSSARDSTSIAPNAPAGFRDPSAAAGGLGYALPPGTSGQQSRDGSGQYSNAAGSSRQPGSGPNGPGNTAAPGSGAPGAGPNSPANGAAPGAGASGAGPNGPGNGAAPGNGAPGATPSGPGNAAAPGGGSSAGGASANGTATGAGGGQGGGDGGDAGGDPVLPPPPYLPGNSPTTTRPARTPPLPLSRLLGNRDWPIFVECQADVIVVRALALRLPLASLESSDPESWQFIERLQKLITDRQATVLPGEPPYRPLIRFQVYPEGLRTYYLAYPRLEALRLPMTRENVVPPRGPRTTVR